jgi:uncharacterized protein CbrC (UPF0167 family)
MPTYSALGIPFPLYEAQVEPSDDSDYAGRGTCRICGVVDTHCFYLGIGTALIIPCPSCSIDNGLDVSDKASANCRRCGSSIPFPTSIATKKEPKVCYSCLRAGKVAFTKDTEFGMISEQEAYSGVTNGVPGLEQDQFEAIVVDAEEDWVGVKIPREVMCELLRTPCYGTWQGECWLFCCRYPMTFVGEWGPEHFEERAADGAAEELFNSVVEDVLPRAWHTLGIGISVYVFECKRCGKLRAHHDSD